MTIFERGHSGDEAEILDLANYAFSRHRYHDFRTLLPKVYGEGMQFADLHLVARNNGKVCGLVATFPQEMRIHDQIHLKAGYVGTVCVHPYMQGAGYMTSLMKMTVDNARSNGLDLLALGGQRQRYQYAGFECGGTRVVFTVTRQNITHALSGVDTTGIHLMEVTSRDISGLDACYSFYVKQWMTATRPRDRFHAIMQSWNGKIFIITKSNVPAGYLYSIGNNIEELTLEDENLLRGVIKSWHDLCGAADFNITAPAHLPARIGGLQAFSEDYRVTDAEMLQIFNWPRVIEALLSLKSQYTKLSDGRMIVDIADSCSFSVEVANNTVQVLHSYSAPHIKLTQASAVTMFFSPITAYSGTLACVNNWFPLPYATPVADQF